MSKRKTGIVKLLIRKLALKLNKLQNSTLKKCIKKQLTALRAAINLYLIRISKTSGNLIKSRMNYPVLGALLEIK